MISDHIRELIDLAVALHVKAGGAEPENLRALLIGSHEIAHLDGQLEGLNRIDAGLKARELITRVRA